MHRFSRISFVSSILLLLRFNFNALNYLSLEEHDAGVTKMRRALSDNSESRAILEIQ